MVKYNEHLTFDEELHKYYVDGKEVISVTQLMRKHSLAPSYQGVNEDVLKASAERGTFIHGEIESFIKNNEEGFSNECINFAKYVKENPISSVESEFAVYNDIVAGTVDLYFERNGVKIIADIKTTSSIHKDAVSWQLSIYNYLNGSKAEKGECFHFNSDGELEVVEIPLKKVEEVEKLLDCERKGEVYQQMTLFSVSEISDFETLEDYIEDLDKKSKEAKKREDEFKAIVMKKMQENGITSIEQGRLKITIVAPTTTTSLDTKRLKEERPDICKEFETTSIRNGYIKITLRKDKE